MSDEKYVNNRIINFMKNNSINKYRYFEEWEPNQPSNNICKCGKCDLVYYYGLKNKHNNIEIVIGSRCIITVEKLMREHESYSTLIGIFKEMILDDYKKKHFKITCVCGSVYDNTGQKRHERTKKHLNFINSNL